MDVCAWLHSMLFHPIAVIPWVFETPLKFWYW